MNECLVPGNHQWDCGGCCKDKGGGGGEVGGGGGGVGGFLLFTLADGGWVNNRLSLSGLTRLSLRHSSLATEAALTKSPQTHHSLQTSCLL